MVSIPVVFLLAPSDTAASGLSLLQVLQEEPPYAPPLFREKCFKDTTLISTNHMQILMY